MKRSTPPSASPHRSALPSTRKLILAHPRFAAALFSTVALTMGSLLPELHGQATWNGSANALWDTAGNWSTGAEPTAAQDVIFPGVIPGTGPTITLTAGELANSIDFQNAYTLAGGNLTLTTGAVTVDPAFTATINSVLLGSTGLTKEGGGTLVLSGANTYTGATTVNAGTLSLAVNGSLAGNAVVNNAGSTLINNGTIAGTTTVNTGGALRGNGNFIGDVTIAAGATHKIGNSPGRTFAVNYANAGTVTFEVQGITNNVFTLVPTTGTDPASILSAAALAFAADPGPNGYNTGGPSAGFDPAAGGPVGGSGTFFHSSMEVSGTFNLTGTLEVTLTAPGSYDAADIKLGDVYDLLDISGGAAATSDFVVGNYNGVGADEAGSGYDFPDISSTGLFFNTSLLESQGLLVVVPEPSRALLVLMAGLGMLTSRRRRRI